MNCKKENLQMLVDWLHAAQEYMFQNVVTARINISGGGLSDTTFATGFLTFVPTHITGLPPHPNVPGRNISDYFQGNLINSLEGEGHTFMTIELAEPVIEIILQNVQDFRIETVKMQAAPCRTSGNSVTIQTKGDDGISYEIILSARRVFAVPHQIAR